MPPLDARHGYQGDIWSVFTPCPDLIVPYDKGVYVFFCKKAIFGHSDAFACPLAGISVGIAQVLDQRGLRKHVSG